MSLCSRRYASEPPSLHDSPREFQYTIEKGHCRSLKVYCLQPSFRRGIPQQMIVARKDRAIYSAHQQCSILKSSIAVRMVYNVSNVSFLSWAKASCKRQRLTNLQSKEHSGMTTIVQCPLWHGRFTSSKLTQLYLSAQEVQARCAAMPE